MYQFTQNESEKISTTYGADPRALFVSSMDATRARPNIRRPLAKLVNRLRNGR